MCTAPAHRRRGRRPVGVVAREVDRLADLGVGLGDGLAGLVDHRRDEVRRGPPRATRRRRVQRLGAVGGRRRRPSRAAADGAGDDRRRPSSIGRHRHRPGRCRRRRARRSRAPTRAPAAAAGSVSGVLREARRTRSSAGRATRRGAVDGTQPVAVRDAERRLLGVHRGLVGEQGVQEVLARGVLLEPPHQVGDGDVEVVPRDHRRVEQDRADVVAHRARLRGRHALQHLDVERLADARARCASRCAGGDVEQVVAGDADAQRGVRAGSSARSTQPQVGRVDVGLGRRTGACGQPCSSASTCSIARLAPLTSRTLRRRAAGCAARGATAVSSSSASDGVGQVGLQHDPRRGVRSARGSDDEPLEHPRP